MITPHLASANLSFITLLRQSLVPAALVLCNPAPPLHSWSISFQTLIICFFTASSVTLPLRSIFLTLLTGSSQVLSFDLLRVLQVGPLTSKIRHEFPTQTNKTFSDLAPQLPWLLPVRPPLLSPTSIPQSNSPFCPHPWPTLHCNHSSDTVNTLRARVLALYLMTNITRFPHQTGGTGRLVGVPHLYTSLPCIFSLPASRSPCLELSSPCPSQILTLLCPVCSH